MCGLDRRITRKYHPRLLRILTQREREMCGVCVCVVFVWCDMCVVCVCVCVVVCVCGVCVERHSGT